jgi:hypothetical protein
MAYSMMTDDDKANGRADKCSQRFEDFINFTQDERKRAEQRRDYRDLKQWTEEQAEILRNREQAPIVIDFVGKKVDALMGVEINRRTDPRAYPRTPEHEQAADAITDALRYVEESNNFDAIATEVFEEKIVEGYAGAIVDVVENAKGEFDVVIYPAHWDRCYFDPHSREKDFSDSTYFGITTWEDVEEAARLFPEHAEALRARINNTSMLDTAFDDRPVEWVNRARNRVRINQEWYLENGKWMLVYYTDDLLLREPVVSHLLDADGVPCCPMELQSDFVDRNNNRYGYIQRFIDPQDEINHRRSKALYLLSSAQVIAEEGAVKDKEAASRELRKAQGWLTIAPGKRLDIDRNIEMGQAQLAFYREAKAEMDAVGVNPELSGRADGPASGRAIMARQQGGLTELAHIYSRHSDWKRRIYRQIWARIKQFWGKQKWVRVTDNDDAMKWVGLNVPVTLAEKMIEQKTGLDLAQIRRQYGQELQQYMQQRPELAQVVEIRNNVAEIDVDIIIEESPDTVSLQQEQFETFAEVLRAGADPQMIRALIELSSMRNKKRVLDLLDGDEQTKAQRQQEQQQQQEIAMRGAAAEIAEKESRAELNQAAAAAKMAEAGMGVGDAPAQPAPPEPKDEVDVFAKMARARKMMAEAEAQELENEAFRAGIGDLLNG